MKSYFSFLFLFLAGCLISRQVQGQDNYDKDVASVTSITEAYYDCISGPIGETRDFERLRNLFHPSATFTYTYWSEEEGRAKLIQFDFDGYLEKLDYLDKRGFYEEELGSQIEEYGAMANVMSSYRFWMEDKTATGRGISLYHYFFDGERYWIMTMFWQMESARFPIPEEFLVSEN